MNLLSLTPTTATIDLGDWNAAARGQHVYVWVDPPRDMLREQTAFRREYADRVRSLTQEKAEDGKTLAANRQALEDFMAGWNKKVYDYYARLWSQGPEGTHWTAAELAELNEKNPRLLEWLILKSQEAVEGHGRAEKNA